jgi:hypothetical protein
MDSMHHPLIRGKEQATTEMTMAYHKEAPSVTDTIQTDPPPTELVRRLDDAHFFLRLVAIELRRFAKQAPDIAVELRHTAQKLHAEADDLAQALTREEAGQCFTLSK